MPDNYWQSIGYVNLNNFSFRIDMFEKIFFLARQKIKKGESIEGLVPNEIHFDVKSLF